MTDSRPPSGSQPARRALAWCAGNRHFLAAAAILAATAIGWSWVISALKIVMIKKAVPWPPGVRVNSETFRIESMPQVFGPYFLAADGELNPPPDGKADGEVELTDDILQALGMATAMDKVRVKDRRSNWYTARIYVDTRKAPGRPYRLWQLEVTFYTGALDKVPHVPERCLAAAGARVTESNRVSIHAPGAPSPWDGQIPLDRTVYQVWNDRSLQVDQYVQYHVFSFNGVPEPSWKRVRLKLNSPFIRYCYFAKIQIAPLSTVSDPAEADREVADFAGYFLPSVLRMLPMPDAVRDLNAPPE